MNECRICNRINYLKMWWTGVSKEYISLVERTATPHRLTTSQLTQPLPTCSVGSYTDRQVVQCTADRAGRGSVS